MGAFSLSFFAIKRRADIQCTSNERERENCDVMMIVGRIRYMCTYLRVYVHGKQSLRWGRLMRVRRRPDNYIYVLVKLPFKRKSEIGFDNFNVL